ncbi:hypothetical protein [Pseudomonas nunensis]|uniref:hypothetical protein n=1 Tax=Pseudomonas nunensis TaxID=2961896 RepID=UPI0025AF3B38|nr:hypothetical protein [Pseudomonas nunensis]MDN3220035.1 hypothetical protein [Pseudomonas nunensis]
MIPTAFSDFMGFVMERTRTSDLKWIEGDRGSYITSHLGMSLYLSHDYDEDRGTSSFWFRLISENGQATPFSVYDYENEYSFMRALYEEVISNANNASHDVARFMRGW